MPFDGNAFVSAYMAVGQNQWYQFGVGVPPILVYFSGDWDVHWGYGILIHVVCVCFCFGGALGVHVFLRSTTPPPPSSSGWFEGRPKEKRYVCVCVFLCVEGSLLGWSSRGCECNPAIWGYPTLRESPIWKSPRREPLQIELFHVQRNKKRVMPMQDHITTSAKLRLLAIVDSFADLFWSFLVVCS